MYAKEQADKVKAAVEKLESGIKDVFSSGRYAEYLSAMSRFHKYSYGNILMIMMQKPDASAVASYGTWKKEFSRQVKKGETGIQIFAPCPYKKWVEQEKIDPATNAPILGADGKAVTERVQTTAQKFKIVYVFDVSQTEGKELPSLGSSALSGNVEQYETMIERLKNLSPVPVAFEDFSKNAHGYFSKLEQRIVVKAGLSEVQTVKTLVHEIAHAKLHNNLDALETVSTKDRAVKEIEAESVAYIVCQHLGIDTADYSFGYVAGWGRSRALDELKNSLSTIHSTAVDIIDSISEESRETAPPAKEKAERRHKTSQIKQVR